MRNTLFLLLLLVSSLVYAGNLEFALLTDIHVTPGNENDKILPSIIDEINQSDVPFVVITGDLTNEGSDEQLLNVKSKLDALKMPYYIIPGNHENNWSQSASKSFFDLWGNDRFVFEYNDIVFTGMNCGPYMKMGDGHVKREDILWLKKTLKDKCTNGKRVVSCIHYPLDADLNYSDSIVSILEQYPTITHLCGHVHRFSHKKEGFIDEVTCRALDMKNGNYGYTIIDIDDEMVKVYDKQLNKDKVGVISFFINKNSGIQSAVSPKSEIDESNLIFADNASVFTRVAADNEVVYFGNSLGVIKAVTIRNGKTLWEYKTDASLFSRPAITKDLVIVPTADYRILGINKKSGKVKWIVKSDGPFVADGIVEGNYLYQGGYKKMMKIDIRNGKVIWEYKDINNYCQASPVISSDKLVFGAWDTYLYCINKNSGKLCWKWSNGRLANMLSPGNCVPVISDDMVVVVAPDRYMTAISLTTGKQLWRNNDYKYRESLGISTDKKFIFAKTMDGEIVCVDALPDYFSKRWVANAGFGYEHAPCLVVERNGIIYAGSRQGVVVAIESKTKKILWSRKFGISEVNGFDFAPNGKIYLSLVEGKVVEL